MTRRAPRNGWTGGQYSVLRFVWGAWLALHFLRALLWVSGPEGRALAQVVWTRPLFELLPNVFAGVATITGTAAVIWLALGLVSSVLLAVGRLDRIASLVAWYVAACWAGGVGLEAVSDWHGGVPYLGWLTLVHWLVPGAPYGSWAARGRADPGNGWALHDVVARAVLVVVLVTDLAHAWVLLAWPGSSALIDFGGHVGLQLGSARGLGALVLLHVLAFDPRWIPRCTDAGPSVLFYDGTCGLCHRSCRFLLSEEREGRAFRMAPLQSGLLEGVLEAGVLHEGDQQATLPDSMVLRTPDGQIAVRSDAVIAVGLRLGGLWALAARVAGWVPRPLRDAGYDLVARARYAIFGRTEQACPLVPEHLSRRFLTADDELPS